MKIMGVLLGLFLSLSVANHHGNILWNSSRDLNWSDFQSNQSRAGQGFYAYTHCTITFQYDWKKVGSTYKMVHDVNAYFVPNRSWSYAAKRTSALLKHEQLHFDITELHARKMRKAFDNYTFKNSYQRDIQNIFDKLTAENQKMQQQYDSQTNHSINKASQAKWEKFVQSELKKWAAYK